MMALTEDLVRACAAEVAGTLQLTYQGMQLDLEQPFRRATMHELVQEATGAPLRLVHNECKPCRVPSRACTWTRASLPAKEPCCGIPLMRHDDLPSSLLEETVHSFLICTCKPELSDPLPWALRRRL